MIFKNFIIFYQVYFKCHEIHTLNIYSSDFHALTRVCHHHHRLIPKHVHTPPCTRQHHSFFPAPRLWELLVYSLSCGFARLLDRLLDLTPATSSLGANSPSENRNNAPASPRTAGSLNGFKEHTSRGSRHKVSPPNSYGIFPLHLH